MRLLVAGRGHEVRGFALAGIDTVTCDRPTQVHTVLVELGADVGVLIVSRWFEQAAREQLAQIRDRTGPPIVLTLPADPEERG